jgi:glycosyltransferase involved in cell wall biosynthesis
MRLQAEFSSDARLLEDAAEMEALEQDIWRRVDVVLYPSQEEVDTVRSLCSEASAKVVLPYCFDRFPLQPAVPENPLVIFVAGFGHPPNVDAAIWLAESIWPLITARAPDARLALVGSNPTAEVTSLRSEAIEVTGWISDDELQRRYQSARVAVVPLRFGAGVKLKVVEALMAGTPLVTTPTGAQGLPGASDIVDIADEAEQFADAVVSLLTCDPAIWLSRSSRQTRYCEAHFSRDNLRISLREALRAASRNYRQAADRSLSQSAQSLDATN